MSDRLSQVVADPSLLEHARRDEGEPLRVLVQLAGAKPRVEVAERDPARPRGPRPIRVSVPDAAAAREEQEQLVRLAQRVEALSGVKPTILGAAHVLATSLDPAALRAVAALDEVARIVPDRLHRRP